MRKYKDVRRSDESGEQETTFFDPERQADVQSIFGIEAPLPSEPTPVFQIGADGDIASTYLLELQRNQHVKQTGSIKIDVRAGRMVTRLINAKLLDRARTHVAQLRRNTACDDAIFIIDLAIENGLRYEDIDPTLTESDYKRLKQHHTVSSARRLWTRVRTNPDLEQFIQLDSALQRGDITLQEIYADPVSYEHARQAAHAYFAETILAEMRIHGMSRELLIVLKTAIQTFGVDINALTISPEEYSTLLEIHTLAS